MNGFHGTYFVYGQTGTGKTHTMGVLRELDEGSTGIIPLSLEFIFKYTEEQQKKKIGGLLDSQVHLSFFQIYQENV